jgi:hypothetical protein
VDRWKTELIGRIVDSIDAHLSGRLSLRKLVEDTRGLFDAADISANQLRGEFESVWAPLSGELDLRIQDWAKPEWTSDERLKTVLLDLRSWASGVSKNSSSPPGSE